MPGAPKGNKNAVKSPEERVSGRIGVPISLSTNLVERLRQAMAVQNGGKLPSDADLKEHVRSLASQAIDDYIEQWSH